MVRVFTKMNAHDTFGKMLEDEVYSKVPPPAAG